MTEHLSNKFFGNKKFKQEHYKAYLNYKRLSQEQIGSIFVPYTNKLANQLSEDESCSKLTIFSEFINENIKKFNKWQFQQLSSWIQISAHVFEQSFEKCLNKKQSFDYFSAVMVRHSLFRPPHSIAIFNYEQTKQITQYWLGTFSRFYQEYSICFSIELNQIIQTICAPFPAIQQSIEKGKQIPREQLGQKIMRDIGVIPKKQKQVKQEPQPQN